MVRGEDAQRFHGGIAGTAVWALSGGLRAAAFGTMS